MSPSGRQPSLPSLLQHHSGHTIISNSFLPSFLLHLCLLPSFVPFPRFYPPFPSSFHRLFTHSLPLQTFLPHLIVSFRLFWPCWLSLAPPLPPLFSAPMAPLLSYIFTTSPSAPSDYPEADPLFSLSLWAVTLPFLHLPPEARLCTFQLIHTRAATNGCFYLSTNK